MKRRPERFKHALPLSGKYQLEVIEFRGPSSGPTAALIAGVHGDEDEGILALRRIAAYLNDVPLSGTVKVLCVANPPAYEAVQRESPVDGLNLARVFPGSESGSITERIAHLITERMIRGADVLVDLHSGGRVGVLKRWCGYVVYDAPASARSAEYARVFGISPVWAHTDKVGGRTLSVAQELRIPAIYAEMAGGGEVRGEEADLYFEGVLNVLGYAGIISRKVIADYSAKLIYGKGGDSDVAIKAPCDGMLVTRLQVGAVLSPGDVLGEIYDDAGRLAAVVSIEDEGVLMWMRRYARVRAGDLLAMTAPAPIEWSAVASRTTMQ